MKAVYCGSVTLSRALTVNTSLRGTHVPKQSIKLQDLGRLLGSLHMSVPAHICVVGLYLTATPFASLRPKGSLSLTQRRLSNYFFGCILRSLHLIYDHFQSNMCWIDLHSRALSFHLPTISFHILDL